MIKKTLKLSEPALDTMEYHWKHLKKEIMYLEDQEEDLTSYAFINRVHEVNNHKEAD